MLSSVLRTVMLLDTVFVTEVLVSVTANCSGKVPSGSIASSGVLQGLTGVGGHRRGRDGPGALQSALRPAADRRRTGVEERPGIAHSPGSGP